MASSEYGGAEESELLLEEGDVYKATTSSDYVVVRRVRLYRSKFITYHDIEENENDNKQWILTSQCELQPRSAADIKEPCTKYVRPRGQWAITTLVKPKSIGSKGQPVKLYMFMLTWPTRWAAKGYTSFAFGFTSAEAARQWHNRLAECLDTAGRLDKPSTAMTAAYSSHNRANSGNVAVPTSGGGTGSAAANGTGSSGGAALAAARASGMSAAAAATAAPVSSSSGLPKASSLSRRISCEGANLGIDPMISQMTGPPLPSRSEEFARRTPAIETAKRTLTYDNGVGAAAAAHDVRVSSNTASSSFFSATAAATAAAGGASAAPAPAVPPARPRAAAAAAAATQAAAQRLLHQHHHHPLPHPPPARPEGGFSPSSSDSEGPDEDSDGGLPMRARSHGPNGAVRVPSGMLGSAAGPSRVPRGTARGDVRHTRQRWVPYKQVNGVAIYHRPQTAGDAEAGVGGEFMVSTIVRGSPRRCLTALTANCGNTTILGPATTLEVLERRQAVDGKEVQRIIVQAPGVTGVVCAPRELVVETVFKTDETGPTLVLMFNSCEVPARFVERRAGESADQQQQQGEAEPVQTALAGGRRSWWRRPVPARVRGGYTIAPLEEYSLDSSPEALVTCIMKVDLGGVCGERSWLRLAADLVGWTDAFLDRMLMAVTLLRDEVEQGRFVVQPLSMMGSSSRAKERDGGTPADLGTARSTDGAAPGVAVACAAACAAATLARRSVRQATIGRTSGRSAPQAGQEAGSAGSAGVAAAAARAVAKASKREADRALLVDGPLTGAAAEGTATAAASAAGGTSGRDVSSDADSAASDAGGAANGGGAADSAPASAAYDASPVPSPSAHQYETLEDVLARMQSLSFLDSKVWDNLHRPGKDAPFKIRGPTYLKDRKKIPAGCSRFVLGSMDVIQHPPGPVTEHVARFIPAIRQSGAPFSVIVHLVIPGTPLLGIVATFVSDRHPAPRGEPPAHPMEDEHDWEPFDFVLHKYMTGSTHTRNHMLKLIPHIADGSWMIKQSVGTTPVILGKQLRTIYYETPQYLEIDIDISANNVASYVTGLVRGATRSLVIDMGFVLEGTTPWELPEALLGTLRLYNLDIRNAKLIDVDTEIPLRPSTLPPPCSATGPAAASTPRPPPGSAAPSAPPSVAKLTPALPLQAAAVASPLAGLGGSGAPPPQRNGSAASLVGGGGSSGSGAGGAPAAPMSAGGGGGAPAGVSGITTASHRRMPSAPSETPRTPSIVGNTAAPPSPARASTSAVVGNGSTPLSVGTPGVINTPAGNNKR